MITVDAECVKTGKVFEVLIENTVRIGDEFNCDGRRLRRKPVVIRSRIMDKPFLAHSLPQEHHVAEGGFTRAPHYVDGVAAFGSKREREEYMARHNSNPIHGDRLEWDQ